jgi:hypothetical protein
MRAGMALRIARAGVAAFQAAVAGLPADDD